MSYCRWSDELDNGEMSRFYTFCTHDPYFRKNKCRVDIWYMVNRPVEDDEQDIIKVNYSYEDIKYMLDNGLAIPPFSTYTIPPAQLQYLRKAMRKFIKFSDRDYKLRAQMKSIRIDTSYWMRRLGDRFRYWCWERFGWFSSVYGDD